ncbi:FeoB-associated Cys-rich membrane protein [Flavobacterium coralii]|nr:FeoB-associated Cys-rich membrane protein [Flavobacterium sp.]|tara:strand:+ start:10214 stop:10339 length:126 start_codon:yes stop_codon:yes gene_type:complete
MTLQEIITYALVAVAVAYLVKKYFFKKKKKGNCANDDCGCH